MVIKTAAAITAGAAKEVAVYTAEPFGAGVAGAGPARLAGTLNLVISRTSITKRISFWSCEPARVDPGSVSVSLTDEPVEALNGVV